MVVMHSLQNMAGKNTRGMKGNSLRADLISSSPPPPPQFYLFQLKVIHLISNEGGGKGEHAIYLVLEGLFLVIYRTKPPPSFPSLNAQPSSIWGLAGETHTPFRLARVESAHTYKRLLAILLHYAYPSFV